MNIGDAARQSGLPAKTIRYYESIGLIGAPQRSEAGYRDFDDTDLHRLRFVARSRALGFSVEEVRRLLTLYADRGRASADVKAMAVEHIDAIERKIADLNAMRRALSQLAEQCHGDSRPHCPILDDLASGPVGETR
ncbi:MAG: Cu(I)-responsive transcriptional regulator [Rhodospirillales bacterium]